MGLGPWLCSYTGCHMRFRTKRMRDKHMEDCPRGKRQ